MNVDSPKPPATVINPVPGTRSIREDAQDVVVPEAERPSQFMASSRHEYTGYMMSGTDTGANMWEVMFHAEA